MGPHTEIVDLAGRMLLPGFQDAHIHPPGSGLEMLRCNLSPSSTSSTPTERVIADYATANPDAPWILGGGWYMDVFPGGHADEGGARRHRSRPSGLPDEP